MTKMHNKFVDWFQDKRARLRGRSGKRRQAQDRPTPLLPPFTSRSSSLTPTPSCTELIAAASVATVNSAFFQHLPPEIRRKILVMTFGDRTMHMSLEFNYPRQLIPGLHSNMPSRRYLPPTDQNIPVRLQLDDQAPMAWQWRGCLCWRFTSHGLGLSNDDCLPGVARCWKDASDVPDMCLIGAMSWLLTCRQAYLEGIEVLYSTNTLSLSNNHSVIIHHLQDLLSPRRLAMITSIELDLSLYNVMGPAGENGQYAGCARDAGQSGFLALLEAIPKALPSLRTVFMDIHGPLFPTVRLEEAPPFHEQHLFKPIDDMVRILGPRLQEFTLSLPFTISLKSMSRAHFEGWEVRRRGWQDSCWRPLSTLDINGQAERALEEKTTVGGSGKQGYWITEGHFDNPYPLMGCFGTGSTDPDRHDAINAELNSWTDKDKPSPSKV